MRPAPVADVLFIGTALGTFALFYLVLAFLGKV